MPEKKDILNHEFHCIRTLRLSCCPDNIPKKLKWYFRHKSKGNPMSQFQQFIPLILIFAIFWFLIIRPQQKKIKDHNAMVSNVKKGDRVVTGGGLIGTITDVSENEVDVDFGNNVKIKSLKSTLADVKSKD